MARYKVRAPYVDAQTRERRKKGDIVELAKDRGDRLVARRLVEPVEREQPVETATAEPQETAAKRTSGKSRKRNSE